MTDAKRNELVESIFFRARERTGTQQATFLDGACQGDQELRSAVEQLLIAESNADSLFERPITLADPVDSSAAERVGSVIGRYKLLQQLGEGGFGVVYMAQQTEPVRRHVALKVIKPGMDSREIVARFEAERQALAMMDHPNIARVLDAGATESGHPYFVMELVRGVPITDYCDQNSLDTCSRLELFNQVCRAVQHAHQKGVIHRDLKPTNVMVTLHDGRPVPKVIDFGVAKALTQLLTEKTLFTRYGQIVGTPQYMSPEQAEMSGLDIDTRSDIYSLGVLLYELLTGNTPIATETLRAAGWDGMRQMICEADPPKPSTRVRTLDDHTATCVASQRSTIPRALSKAIAGDLDWIVMKSLEKERNHRYESANALIEDVQRYLKDEPVQAGPPTFGYQLRKLYRRNRVAVTTIAAIAGALVVGVVLIAAAWLKADQARRHADQLRGQAMASSRAATTQAAAAEHAAARATASLEVLQSLLAQASPDAKAGAEVTVQQYLTSFAARLNANQLTDKVVEIDVRMTLASAFARFAQLDEAMEQLAIVERLGRATFAKRKYERIRFLTSVADKLVQARRETEAKQLLFEILPEVESDRDLKVNAVEVLTRLAQRDWSRPDKALDHVRRACAIADQLETQQKFELRINPYRQLGVVLNKRDDYEPAREACRRSMELVREMSDNNEHVKTLILQSRICNLAGEGDLAVSYADQAVGAVEHDGLYHLHNHVLHHRMELEFTRHNVDVVKQVALRCKRAIDDYWQRTHGFESGVALGSVIGALQSVQATDAADDLSQKLAGLPRHQQATAYLHVAEWLRYRGYLAQADQFSELVAEFRSFITVNSLTWNEVHRGRCRSDARDFETAMKHFRQALQLTALEAEPNYWNIFAIRLMIAGTLEALGRNDEATEQYAALAADLPTHSNRLWGTATPAALIVAAYKSAAVSDLQEPELVKAIHDLQETPPPDPISLAWGHAGLGLMHQHAGVDAAAIDRFVQAVRTRPGTFEPALSEWINDYLVDLMCRAGRFDLLEQVLREDVRRRDSEFMAFHVERAFTRLRLVQFLLDNERSLSGARQLLDDVAKIYVHHGDFMPVREWRKLDDLREQVETRLDETP